MKAAYGKEPFDLKLTLLRLMRQALPMCLWMVAGIVVLFGSYCLKSYVFHTTTYSGKSTFRVEYSDENWSANLTYINYATWNTYIKSEEFQNLLLKYMDDELRSLPAEERKNAYTATVETEIRLVEVISNCKEKGKAEKFAKAIEEAMPAEFPGFCSDVSKMRVIDSARVAETYQDVRPLRAFILSVVVSVVFVFLIFVIKELGCDDIHLPGIFTTRFGIKSLGADCDLAFASNAIALFPEKNVAILPVSENGDVAKLKVDLEKALGEDANVVTYPTPVLSPEALNELKNAKILLAVPYEKGNSGKLQYVLELLAMRELEPMAAVLTDADAWLLNMYYGKM